jgi:glycosyltransferase involved in cell wall biosynthesis
VVRRLRRAAEADRRIRLHAGYVPDDEVQFYLAAADALVAPFERILTSSSVVVGLSYGLPVVAPDLGCMAEQIGAAGIVYPPGDDGLAWALAELKRADRTAMSAAARAIDATLGWDDIARQTAAVYRAALGEKA